MDTMLYDKSIPLISSLQTTFQDQAGFMQLMSVVFDPKYAFLIYSPIAYLIDHRVGKKLILTTVLAEWLNMILKWLLHGERPYWYVHSSGHFDTQQMNIMQFPITCELGPGHPSGHAMVTAAVWYIILDSALQAYQRRLQHDNYLATLKLSTWSLYASLLLTVSVSRVFLGCHFPHQCMAGAMLGLLVARYVSKMNTSAFHFLTASIGVFTTAFATFATLQHLGLDPSWTIKMATAHCVKREYIHLDTAPFFSIMRYSGFALGTGLALCVPSVRNYIALGNSNDNDDGDESQLKKPRNISWLWAKLLMAMLMARLLDNLTLLVSQGNSVLFYLSAFLAYTGFSFAFVNL